MRGLPGTRRACLAVIIAFFSCACDERGVSGLEPGLEDAGHVGNAEPRDAEARDAGARDVDAPDLTRFFDVDSPGPGSVPVTHTATVAVRAVRDRGAAAIIEITATVDALQTGELRTRATCLADPAAEPDSLCETFAPTGTCGLHRKRTWFVAPDSADLGVLVLRDPRILIPGGAVIPNGVRQPVQLRFEPNLGRYVVTTPATLPSDLLIYTTTYASLLDFEGAGSELTQEQSFPPRVEGDLPRHRMPLEICSAGMTSAEGCYATLTPTSEALLSSALVIGDRDLDFGFVIPPDINPEGVMRNEVVIEGRSHEIRCIANSDADGLVRVPLRLLERFRIAEALSPGNLGAQVDLRFQRAYRFRVAVPANLVGESPTRTDFRLELAYVWKTKLAF